MSHDGDSESELPDGEAPEPSAEAAGEGDPAAATDALTEGAHIDRMYRDWFLEYASYVILDRAVPALDDGLKPVQRRIVHAMKLMDDGRYHKVANIIGNTMRFHPHGDASIYEALVNLGQKDLLVDTQGNWGNILTGDPAAAPRYIEARLSKLALEILFSPEITTWQLSYDGRAKEPVSFPVKFPLLLALGVEGIAVGLSTRILPHNFVDLCKGAIKVLEGKPAKLAPDFPTGGVADVSDYQGGGRGGRVRVRARVEIVDHKTLRIHEVPFGTTTQSLIDSIIAANEKGKIRIRKVEDNTAAEVEILVHLPGGVSPEVTVDALYAFTDCEVSLAPNCCVIVDNRPLFTTVEEALNRSVADTKRMLGAELEVRLGELDDKWHFGSLEKIFIENRIYRDIEECETWEAVLAAIDAGLEPHKKLLRREVTEDDLVRLTEIKIKRISKFDGFKADEALRSLEAEMAEVKHHLAHLTEYAIAWFKRLLDKYGKGRERRTELREFGTVQAAVVAAATEKLYVNRAEGFVGTGLKKDEFVSECSTLDEIIVFRGDGKYLVTKVSDKAFVGKDILHVDVFRRGDERTIYHLIYRDGKQGPSYVKRFAVTAVVRDREYDLTAGTAGSEVHYFTVNPAGEAEVVEVQLSPKAQTRRREFEYDFGELAIKGRGAKGNLLTKFPIKKIVRRSVGPSTLAPEELWFDKVSLRLNKEAHGESLGLFGGDDRIVVIYGNGQLDVTDFNPQNVYGEGILRISKRPRHGIATLVYWHGEKGEYYVKRFDIPSEPTGRRVDLLPEVPGCKLVVATVASFPRVKLHFTATKKGTPDPIEVTLHDFIDVKGIAAQGNRLHKAAIKKIEALDPFPEPDPEPESEPEPVDTVDDRHEAPARAVAVSKDPSAAKDNLRLF